MPPYYLETKYNTAHTNSQKETLIFLRGWLSKYHLDNMWQQSVSRDLSIVTPQLLFSSFLRARLSTATSIRFFSSRPSPQCKSRLLRERSSSTYSHLCMSMTITLVSFLQTCAIASSQFPVQRDHHDPSISRLLLPVFWYGCEATLECPLQGTDLGRFLWEICSCPCSTSQLSPPPILSKGKVDSNTSVVTGFTGRKLMITSDCLTNFSSRCVLCYISLNTNTHTHHRENRNTVRSTRECRVQVRMTVPTPQTQNGRS